MCKPNKVQWVFDFPEGCPCQYRILFLPYVAVGIPANVHTIYCGVIVFPHSWPEYLGLTQSWQGSAPWAALYPTVCGIALLGNRSGLLTPRWYNSPSDLFSFQKGTPLLVHPMLHSNVGLPPGGGTPIDYLYGYVPPKGVVILKLLI